MEVVVGRIGRAHGIRGDVQVEVRTDEPERRLAPGERLLTSPATVGPLTVARARWHSGRLLLAFDEVPDRSSAEAVRGVELLVDVDPDELPEDPEEFYDRHLVGLLAQDVSGRRLGLVREVVHLPGQDLLAVSAEPDGREVLVPFVTALVPSVDLQAGLVVVDPPAGLFDDQG